MNIPIRLAFISKIVNPILLVNLFLDADVLEAQRTRCEIKFFMVASAVVLTMTLLFFK